MAEDDEKTKDLVYYFRFIRRRPLAAVGATVLAVFVAIATGLGAWLSDKAKSIAQSACEYANVCHAPAPAEVPPWKITFSTAVPNCLLGRLAEKLRDWSPPISWEAGADRLVICADAIVEGQKHDIPRLIQERFPRCFNVEASEASITVRTELEKGAVCRAPYRYDGEELIKASLRRGLFVCFPGADMESGISSFSFAGTEVPVCSEDIMRGHNFIRP